MTRLKKDEIKPCNEGTDSTPPQSWHKDMKTHALTSERSEDVSGLMLSLM